MIKSFLKAVYSTLKSWLTLGHRAATRTRKRMLYTYWIGTVVYVALVLGTWHHVAYTWVEPLLAAGHLSENWKQVVRVSDLVFWIGLFALICRPWAEWIVANPAYEKFWSPYHD